MIPTLDPRMAGAEVNDVLRFGDVVLDEARHEVVRAGVALELTPTEFALLRFLLLNPKRVLSKYQILHNAWRHDFSGDVRVVDRYVSYLRRKLNQAGPELIRTVRHRGYALELPARGRSAAR